MPILRKHTIGAALLLLAVGVAHAQYVWIGPNGTRQYSDKPPPPGTPASKIIKGPGRAADDAAPDAPAPAKPDAKPAETKAAPTLAEREAAFRERSKARDELAGKQNEEAERKRRLAEHCASAREAQAQYTSGIRVAHVGPDGEKTYMTDEQRATRADAANRALAECRSAGG